MEYPIGRARSIASAELPPDLTAAFEKFVGDYGSFRNWAVRAHILAETNHLRSKLLDWRALGSLWERYLDIVFVGASGLHECHYCVAHHKPSLAAKRVRRNWFGR